MRTCVYSVIRVQSIMASIVSARSLVASALLAVLVGSAYGEQHVRGAAREPLEVELAVQSSAAKDSSNAVEARQLSAEDEDRKLANFYGAWYGGGYYAAYGYGGFYGGYAAWCVLRPALFLRART